MIMQIDKAPMPRSPSEALGFIAPTHLSHLRIYIVATTCHAVRKVNGTDLHHFSNIQFQKTWRDLLFQAYVNALAKPEFRRMFRDLHPRKPSAPYEQDLPSQSSLPPSPPSSDQDPLEHAILICTFTRGEAL